MSDPAATVHEVRNLVATILGRCELMRAGIGGDLTPAQVRSVEVIERNARRIDVLADRLEAPRAT